MQITKEQLQSLTEVIEDSAQYFCDEEIVSGQLCWTVIESLATAKLAELNGLVTA